MGRVGGGGGSSSGGLDHDGDCSEAGFLAPGAFPLPPRAFVGAGEREEANTWVLSTSMDRKVVAGIAGRACGGCGGRVAACALVCPKCTSAAPQCVVTGAPIPLEQVVECPGCGSKAARPAWEAVVGRTRVCCWCACPAK
jgi:hypothetical protein